MGFAPRRLTLHGLGLAIQAPQAQAESLPFKQRRNGRLRGFANPRMELESIESRSGVGIQRP